MQYFEATDSNGTELYLFQLEGNSFISVPKEQLEFKPISPEELKEMKEADDESFKNIHSAPSIELIKCKDCIYYEPLGYDAPKDGWCNTPKLYCDGFWVDEDDFCSDAKKEETNES